MAPHTPLHSSRPGEPGTLLESLTASGRARAADVSPEQIKKVAEDFETILLGQIVKGLRRTVPEGEDSSHAQMYRDLFDEQLAADLARKGGIGLATVIRTYLERGSEAPVRGSEAPVRGSEAPVRGPEGPVPAGLSPIGAAPR